MSFCVVYVFYMEFLLCLFLFASVCCIFFISFLSTLFFLLFLYACWLLRLIFSLFSFFLFLVFLFFFFFKQKTAYEMRISDWSSDVCSSDLLSGERLWRLHLFHRAAAVRAGRDRRRAGPDTGYGPRAVAAFTDGRHGARSLSRRRDRHRPFIDPDRSGDHRRERSDAGSQCGARGGGDFGKRNPSANGAERHGANPLHAERRSFR